MCVCVCLFASVLIVPIWSEQSWLWVLPCPPYASIYHRQQWRDTKALGASRWFCSNCSACVTLLNRCAWWQPAAMGIPQVRRLLCVCFQGCKHNASILCHLPYFSMQMLMSVLGFDSNTCVLCKFGTNRKPLHYTLSYTSQVSGRRSAQLSWQNVSYTRPRCLKHLSLSLC